MKTIKKAYAKINLTLEALFRREDGYHELRGIMQSVDIYDAIHVERLPEGIEITSDIPLPHNNTMRKAAELFLAGRGGARIYAEKNIPSEAGMGGASADAAAVLTALNELYADTELFRTQNELYEIGLLVGADVPFCLMGGCALACGVGERLTYIPHVQLHLVIVKGNKGISTATLFGNLNAPSASKYQEKSKPSPTDGAMLAITSGNLKKLCDHIHNDLQSSACAVAPEISTYIERLKKLGALGACMTGSGSAVFGIFKSKADAEYASRQFEDCEFAAVCSSVGGSGLIPKYAPEELYVEKQRSFACSAFAYGKRGNVAANGCGLIAIHNMLVAANRGREFSRLYESYRTEPLLTVAGGKLGTNPFKMRGLLRRLFGKANVRSRRLEDSFCHDGLVILYAWKNKKRIGAHFVTAVVEKDGRFRVHNESGLRGCFSPKEISAFYRRKGHLLIKVWSVDFLSLK